MFGFANEVVGFENEGQKLKLEVAGFINEVGWSRVEYQGTESK